MPNKPSFSKAQITAAVDWYLCGDNYKRYRLGNGELSNFPRAVQAYADELKQTERFFPERKITYKSFFADGKTAIIAELNRQRLILISELFQILNFQTSSLPILKSLTSKIPRSRFEYVWPLAENNNNYFDFCYFNNPETNLLAAILEMIEGDKTIYEKIGMNQDVSLTSCFVSVKDLDSYSSDVMFPHVTIVSNGAVIVPKLQLEEKYNFYRITGCEELSYQGYKPATPYINLHNVELPTCTMKYVRPSEDGKEPEAYFLQHSYYRPDQPVRLGGGDEYSHYISIKPDYIVFFPVFKKINERDMEKFPNVTYNPRSFRSQNLLTEQEFLRQIAEGDIVLEAESPGPSIKPPKNELERANLRKPKIARNAGPFI